MMELKKPDIESLTAVIALSYSLIFQLLIVNSYLFGEKWTQVLTFNGMGEGYLEMLIVFPLCIIISSIGFIRAKRNL